MSLFGDLHAAAFNAEDFAGDMRANILRLFALHGPMTAATLAMRYRRTHGEHLDAMFIIERLDELILAGDVFETSAREQLPHGASVTIWAAKESA